jgi:hypothetical protein
VKFEQNSLAPAFTWIRNRFFALTPIAWLRQAASLQVVNPAIPALHGIEVDILRDGSLDLPKGLLTGMDIVVGSVHMLMAEF